jgi:hypothetical protein
MNVKKIAKSILFSFVIMVILYLTIVPILAYFFGEELGVFLAISFVQISLMLYMIIK